MILWPWYVWHGHLKKTGYCEGGVHLSLLSPVASLNTKDFVADCGHQEQHWQSSNAFVLEPQIQNLWAGIEEVMTWVSSSSCLAGEDQVVYKELLVTFSASLNETSAFNRQDTAISSGIWSLYSVALRLLCVPIFHFLMFVTHQRGFYSTHQWMWFQEMLFQEFKEFRLRMSTTIICLVSSTVCTNFQEFNICALLVFMCM